MTTLNEHLAAYPRGRQYSYCVRVRGLPYGYSDGRADWNAYSQARWSTTVLPQLARSDWQFKFESNPLEPLTVGSGISVELVADAGGIIRSLFASTREPDFELIPNITAIPTTLTVFDVDDGSLIEQGSKLYWGLETMNVVSVVSDTVTVERGYFDSTRRRYQEINTNSALAQTEGLQGLIPMDPLTSHPVIWRGRYVDVLVGVIEDDGVLGDVWPIWAGRLDSFSLDGRTVKMAVDPLTAAIAKDNWPRAMPKGSMQSDTVRIFLKQEDLAIWFSVSNPAETTLDAGNRVECGTYDTASPSVFTPYTADSAGEWMTLERIAQLIQDTLIYGAITRSGAGTTYDILFNNFTFSVARQGDDSDSWLTLAYNNLSEIVFVIQTNKGIFDKLVKAIDSGDTGTVTVTPVRWTIPGHHAEGSQGIFGAFGHGSGFVLESVGNTLACYLDTLAQPFDEVRGGCYNVTNAEMRGFLKVTSGDECELMSFTSSGVGNDGAFYADLGERGLGATGQKPWGVGHEPTTVEQLAVVHVGEPMAMSALILYLLTSTAAEHISTVAPPTGGNGNYDYLGEWVGLGVPEDLVDREGIISKLSATDLPRPFMFWVEEAGKGKDALEELLRAHGIYFVTRRFTRDQVEHFGLSVDVVDLAVTSQYNETLTDSVVLANTKPRVDINERLLINHVAVSPHYRFGSDVGDTGGKRYAYSSESIAKFGQAKTLELAPNAIYNIFSSQFGGTYQNNSQIATAMATAIGLRWFGAYANGNFTLEAETPHAGWKFQAGDRILIVLTGVPNPDGSDGYESVAAKVADVTHKHGSSAGGRVVLRLSTAQASELAPCFTVKAIDGADITVATVDNGTGYTGTWSERVQNGAVPYEEQEISFGPVYPPFSGQSAPATDADWFDVAYHTDGPLRIRMWERGDYDNYEDYEVLTRAGNVLTLDGSPTFTVSNEFQIIATLGDYLSDSSTLHKTYAHLGSNATKSLLGTGDGLEDRAKKWV